MRWPVRPPAPPVTGVNAAPGQRGAGERPASCTAVGMTPELRATRTLRNSARIGDPGCSRAAAQEVAAATDGTRLRGLTTTFNATQEGRETVFDVPLRTETAVQPSSVRLPLSSSSARECEPEGDHARAELQCPPRRSPNVQPAAVCRHRTRRLPWVQSWNWRQVCRGCHVLGSRIDKRGRAAERGALLRPNASAVAMHQARVWRFGARRAPRSYARPAVPWCISTRRAGRLGRRGATRLRRGMAARGGTARPTGDAANFMQRSYAWRPRCARESGSSRRGRASWRMETSGISSNLRPQQPPRLPSPP